MAKIFSRKNAPAAAAKPTAGPATAVAGVTANDPEVSTLAAVAVGRGPVGDVAVDQAAGVVVTANHGNGSISVLDAETLAPRHLIGLGGAPQVLAVAEDRAYVAISATKYDAVMVVDTAAGAVIGSYPLAFSATSMSLTADGKKLFVGRTDDDSADVVVIDVTAERVGTITLPYRPGTSVDAVSVDAEGRRLYVATTGLAGSALLTVDTGTGRVLRRLRLASPIRDLAVTAEGLAYVLRSDRRHGGSIDIIDVTANQVADTVLVGGAPTQLTVSPDGTRAYVVDYDRVAVFDTLTTELVDELTGDGRPSCVAVRADGRRLYVADYAGAVTVLDVPGSALPLRYTPFLATEPIARPDVRELSRAV
ncbi:YncE family protein [Mycobacterium sp. PS03-16]|uniref:YncE family protein n=1 Tax=Mycobacterium sp. PS03-16 TaxID=2559611 RepID=UPI001073D002|nr:YncE family protein [Mycobacterium sp. PS03-16]TFV60964.1 YncE family protein [Mycobacterium sp. PS03-16]